jgi:transposase-like protein
MVRQISNEVKVQVLYETGTKKVKTIAKKTGIPERTVRWYIARLNADDQGIKERKKQKNRKVTPALKKKVIEQVRLKKKPSLRKIAASLNICAETVRKIILNSGWKYEVRKQRFRLDPAKKEQRLAFAREMIPRYTDWGYTFISDECSIWMDKSKPKGKWVSRQRVIPPMSFDENRMEIEAETDAGTDNEEEMEIESTKNQADESDDDLITTTHGAKLHLWGAISARGATRLEIFEGNLNSDRYIEILKRKKKDMDKLYPEGYYFQQDGNPCHTSKKSLAYVIKTFDNRLEWPAYSPDLSPIENVWAWLKSEVGKDKPESMQRFKKSIRKHWKRLTPEFLEPYFDSMNHRMELVVAGHGARINY